MNYKIFHKLSKNRIVKGLYIMFVNACSILPDKPYLCMMYRIRTGQKLHLAQPVTFNEKIQKLKIESKHKEYFQYVDKLLARDFIAKTIGQEHLVPIYGFYDRFEDINIESLPEQFVVKCTHDSGSVVVCNSKKELLDNKEKFKKALKRKYYYASRDYSYKGTKPRLIIEKKLDNGNNEGLTDYKFYCFDGKPTYLYISKGLQDHLTARISFYNLDFTPAPFWRSDYKPLEETPHKPNHYDEMLKIAETLAAPKGEKLPFVRVDLYEVDDTVYFSEMTFAPCGGYMPFEPKEYDLVLGELIRI